MDQDQNVFKITIYGTEYPIKGDADTNSEYIRQVADYVDRKMREIDENTQSKSSLKVAILAALNITDELFRERQEKKALESNLDGKLRDLSKLIDHCLRGEVAE